MSALTPAQKVRNQHIAKVKADITRLSNAVTALEQYTAELPDWDYVGDWQHLERIVSESANTTEHIVMVAK